MAKLHCMLVAAATLGMAACGSSSDKAASSSTDTGPTDTTSILRTTCTTDAHVSTYAAHAKYSGDFYTLEFVSASPAPPAVGNNTWTFQLLDPNSNPVSGAAVNFGATMPGEIPGVAVTAPVVASGNSYSVTNVNLSAAGVWQFILSIDATVTDQIVFDFCAGS